MKNVLIIANTNVFAGAEFVLLDYLKENNEHQFYIYTNSVYSVSKNYEGIIREAQIYVSDSMNVVSIRKFPLKSFFNILKNLYKIHQIVKANSIEVLYGNNTIDILLIALYKKWVNKNIKIIGHIHDIVTRKLYAFFIRKHEKYIDLFIVPSIATKSALEKFVQKKEKINVVYNGIEVKKEKTVNGNANRLDEIKDLYGIPKDKKILCFIGQICEGKRPELFVEILEKINKIRHEYIGVMMGDVIDANLFCQLKKSAGHFCIPINFLGKLSRDELNHNIYPIIDALILTSDRDSLPTVILEAMAKRKIVIARDVDGVKEMITNEYDGFLFDYQEQADVIARKINKILLMPNTELDLIRENAKETILSKFNPEKKKEIVNKFISSL